MAKFRDATGRVVMRSTKQRAHRDALKVVLTWEDSAMKARAGELTQSASVKILRDLIEQTIGQTLKMPSIRETLNSYLDACKATGAADSTLIRYRPIFNRFLSHIGEVRTRASVASATVSEFESWRNAELAAGVSGKSANLGALRAGLMAALVGPVAAVVWGGIGTIAVTAAVARFVPTLGRLAPLHALRPEE